MWLHCKYAVNFQGRQIVFMKERPIDKSKLAGYKHQTNPGYAPARQTLHTLKEPHSFTKTIKFVAQKINHVHQIALDQL